jgi:hypothetical protein
MSKHTDKKNKEGLQLRLTPIENKLVDIFVDCYDKDDVTNLINFLRDNFKEREEVPTNGHKVTLSFMWDKSQYEYAKEYPHMIDAVHEYIAQYGMPEEAVVEIDKD